MTTITIDGNTVEIMDGDSVYCSSPDAYIEWEMLLPAERETIAKLKNQINKSTGELSALIQNIQYAGIVPAPCLSGSLRCPVEPSDISSHGRVTAVC
ncbi:MAG: hypothetical protein WA003_08085 [Desulfuromonadaceae bacterium]